MGAIWAGAADIPAFRSMRTLRALRPLRAVSRWEGMRVSTAGNHIKTHHTHTLTHTKNRSIYSNTQLYTEINVAIERFSCKNDKFNKFLIVRLFRANRLPNFNI